MAQTSYGPARPRASLTPAPRPAAKRDANPSRC